MEEWVICDGETVPDCEYADVVFRSGATREVQSVAYWSGSEHGASNRFVHTGSAFDITAYRRRVRITSYNLFAAQEPGMHTLTFKNKDARPKTTELTVSLASVEPIMAWYGAYYAGDRYKVFLDGQRLQVDQNGEWVRHAN